MRTYKSVLSQSDIEVDIILVVNGKKSEQIAKMLQNKVNGNAKVISTIKRGKAYAINNALKHVETEWFGV